MLKQQVIIGFILGIIVSMIFSAIIFFSNNPGLPQQEYIHLFFDGKIIVPVLSISLLANFAMFFIFIKFNKDEISKGILVATILIGIVVLILKFL